MNKITAEIAEQEVQNWLEFKKVSERKRENYKDNIETIVNAMVDGVLVLEPDTFTFKQTLKHKIAPDEKSQQSGSIEELEYKPRITVRQVQMQLQGIKASDVQGMILGYACALTGKPKGILAALDTEDFNTVQAIAIFFL